MTKSKVLNENVIAKIDAVIDELKQVKIETEQDKIGVESRISVLEWLKSGRSGHLKVD
ncbi:MAG: hypothetical protein IJD69_00305 [Alphaproteobacteria bacterium]|nr:hypothetical protein [Alphaproteobacteria bacterium]MBQ4129807.1 hypothetical protein [Alphaproteobacteria bacterium]